jgi:WD40 repeat protein
MLVTGSDDSTAIMWSLDEHGGAENLGRLQGHASYINAVAIVERPNAPCVVLTGSADSTIRKWDVTKCECLFVYEGHTARVQK